MLSKNYGLHTAKVPSFHMWQFMMPCHLWKISCIGYAWFPRIYRMRYDIQLLSQGEKTACPIWVKHPIFDNAFLELSGQNTDKSDAKRIFPLLEHFVCLLYVDQETRVDDARYTLLINKGKDSDDMPPSSDALYQHTLRSYHQSGNIWSHIFQAIFNEGFIPGWMWQKVGDCRVPVPVYIIKEIISRSMKELSMCGCKIQCKRNCKCKKEPAQPCTRLCGSQGKRV